MKHIETPIVQATKTKKGRIEGVIRVEANFGTDIREGVPNNILKVLMG